MNFRMALVRFCSVAVRTAVPVFRSDSSSEEGLPLCFCTVLRGEHSVAVLVLVPGTIALMVPVPVLVSGKDGSDGSGFRFRFGS